jgi:DNA repair protein RecN (Recombination protein N)
VDEKTYAQQLDLLRFQVKEIEAARFAAGRGRGSSRRNTIAPATPRNLLQLSQAALDVLSESETSLLTQAGQFGRTLHELQRVDAGAAALVELHEQGVSVLRDLQTELSRYADKVDVDPARLAELDERLNLIHSLKRKYGATLAEVIAFGAEAKTKLQALESRDAELARLNAALARLDAELLKAGKKAFCRAQEGDSATGQSRRQTTCRSWLQAKQV